MKSVKCGCRNSTNGFASIPRTACIFRIATAPSCPRWSFPKGQAILPSNSCSLKRKPVSRELLISYRGLWFWLRNDMATNPINIYDLNKYRVKAVSNQVDLAQLAFGDLYTLTPEELYAPPEFAVK